MLEMLIKLDWRRKVIQSAVISVIAIGIPLFSLAFNFNPLQPVNAEGYLLEQYIGSIALLQINTNIHLIGFITGKGFPATVALQSSNNLLIAQVR